MDKTRELTLRLHQQAIIAELGLSALRLEGLQPLLEMAASLAGRGLSSDFTKVLQYLPEEGNFLLRAGHGWREGEVGRVRIGSDLESPAGYAYRTGKPVISNHLENETRFRTPRLLAEHGVRRAINVIIRGSGEPFGVLEVDGRDREDFTTDDVHFLQALANTLGVAVDRELSGREMERLHRLAERRAREAEEALAARDALLAEKDLLMREIDHRVKNSLTMTRSMLSIQARASTEDTARQALEEAAQRVATIARAHDRLHRSARIGVVEVSDYLGELCGELRAASGLTDGGRSLHCDVASRDWPADDAVPIGLIVTELVTIAARAGGGDLHLRFGPGAQGALSLELRDDGLPPDFDPGSSLGVTIIQSMSQKLNGSFVWGPAAGDPGLIFALTLPGQPLPGG
ncbi:sensor histidine kinase [Roseomonas sp. KE0001]|uniref:sensor histidine kinase n=1 Tax=Roseomonas sp. KE0001 TaxID=2479201 RepID=UPI0018DF0374|nr:histidine kinase dimerization/phosphoacceptor domain -containing protein [Roseomonas sp. KE0001]MBI0432528.1 GAF domain-containing protein [Roseomonas sp. KE0001]